MKPTDIVNQQKFRQALLFEDLRDDLTDYRTGTDIDFEYEDGRLWIKAEVKEYGKEITTGQRILFERFVENLSNYTAFACVLWHAAAPEEDIYIKDCYLMRYYWKSPQGCKWITPDKPIPFKKAFKHLVDTHGRG